MPQTKKTTKKVDTQPKKEATEELMEFEHFVSRQPSHSGRGKSWLFVTLFIIIVILGVAWLYVSQDKNLAVENKFKAVALDNGQVYYAKVVKEDALNIYLDEVYYIKLEQQLIPAQEEGAEDQTMEVPILVKRGSELHKPSGLLQINRDKLVAIEEIGPDSEILAEIERQTAE
ncbi:hypothetical protein C4566_02535 [Candidatus Parcubacteria bacterium]|nr:MAG: hypothetical protein C4566_02535 [Candidatus Parcubacteria bacterium]